MWSGAGDDKKTWGPGGPTLPRTPLVGRGMIAARDGEPGTFLGRTQPPDLLSGTFLDLAGWRGGEDVTDASDNHYANLDKIATLYNASPADGGDLVLPGSRFWYHAEVFGAPRLRFLASPANQDTPPGFERPSQAAIASLQDPALVCYYLFFPGCDDPLEGCDPEFSKLFGAFAGDWACIAVLLEGAGNQTKYKPKFIGLTSRNPGAIQFRATAAAPACRCSIGRTPAPRSGCCGPASISRSIRASSSPAATTACICTRETRPLRRSRRRTCQAASAG